MPAPGETLDLESLPVVRGLPQGRRNSTVASDGTPPNSPWRGDLALVCDSPTTATATSLRGTKTSHSYGVLKGKDLPEPELWSRVISVGVR